MTISIVDVSRNAFLRDLDTFISIHLRAMDYPENVRSARTNMWKTTAISNFPFVCCAAVYHDERDHGLTPWWFRPSEKRHDSKTRIAGFIFGIKGKPTHWWNQQIRYSLQAAGVPAFVTNQLMSNYMELSELHVDPEFQGHNIGKQLLEAFEKRINEPKILLSTPEVPDEDNRAFRLYRRMGFQDVIRYMKFPSDDRPFAILGARTPLAGHLPLLEI